MTTDQIRTIDSYVDTSDASGLSAEEQAAKIVAKARYEAFRMVTDARVEAEAILAEAKPVHQLGGEAEDNADDGEALVAAVEQAAAILERARSDAEEVGEAIVERATAEATEIVARARSRAEADQAELRAEYESLERKVTTTRSVLEGLESRLTAIATTAPTPTPGATNSSAAPHAEQSDAPPKEGPTVTAPGRKAMWAPRQHTGISLPDQSERSGEMSSEVADAERSAPAVLDYSPSVPPPPKASETPEMDEVPDERGSYYSRRSAKLPRIGDSAGHDALGAMKSVRKATDF